MLSSGIETGKEEARQLLRRASSRFNGLLSGYRSLSVHSDDFDRHEYGKMLRPLVTLWLHLYRCAGQKDKQGSLSGRGATSDGCQTRLSEISVFMTEPDCHNLELTL